MANYLKQNSKITGGIVLFLLVFLSSLAFGALNVTTSFDLDRDGDVDGRALKILISNPGIIGLGDFVLDFGKAP